MNKQLSEFFGEEFKLASQASMGPLKHVTATLTFHSIKGQKEDFLQVDKHIRLISLRLPSIFLDDNNFFSLHF